MEIIQEQELYLEKKTHGKREKIVNNGVEIKALPALQKLVYQMKVVNVSEWYELLNIHQYEHPQQFSLKIRKYT